MKKNKIFVNKIERKVGNNQSFYDIKEDDNINTFPEIKENDNLTVKDKLDKLLNRNGYVFNVDVKIITYNKAYDTRVAGKVNNHLITLDNDIINISDIKDIIIKD